MLHQTDLGNARIAQFLDTARRNSERRELKNRGSPPDHRFRHYMAVPLLVSGAKLNGMQPAVIGRVVVRDREGHLPPGLPGAV